MNVLVAAGSLVSVLLLAVLSRALGLGGDVRIAGRDEALRLAEAEGFSATDIAVDRAGIAAIARDAAGRHMLIRRHGVNFVARILHAPLDARLDQNFLTLGTGERLFGRITLDLGSAASNWAASLRAVR
jgi:hypothetical protein